MLKTIHVNRDGKRHAVSFFRDSTDASVEKAIANAFDPPLEHNIKLFCRIGNGSKPIIAVSGALGPEYEYDVEGLPKGERTRCFTFSCSLHVCGDRCCKPINSLCVKMWQMHRAHGFTRLSVCEAATDA
jgi:hypothetical protein